MEKAKNIKIGNYKSELELRSDITRMVKKLVESHLVLSERGINLVTEINLIHDLDFDRYFIADRTTANKHPYEATEFFNLLAIDSDLVSEFFCEIAYATEKEKVNQLVTYFAGLCYANLADKVAL